MEAIPDISDLVAVTDAVLFLISESHAKRNLNFLANSGLNIDIKKWIPKPIAHLCMSSIYVLVSTYEVTGSLR